MDTVRTSYTCSCDIAYEAFEHEGTATRVRSEALGDKFVAVIPPSVNEDYHFEITTEGLVVDIPGSARKAIRAATIWDLRTPGGWQFEVYSKEVNQGKKGPELSKANDSSSLDPKTHAIVDVDVTLQPYWKRFENTPDGIARTEIGTQKVKISSRTQFENAPWVDDQGKSHEGCHLVADSKEVAREGDAVDESHGLLMSMLHNRAESMAGEKIKRRQLFFRDNILPAACRLKPDEFP